MKPIIGVVEWPYSDIDNDYIFEVPNKITEKILIAGGIPIGIFPTQICNFQDTRLDDMNKISYNEKHDLIQALKMCDAIIKPGATKVYEFDKFIQSYTESVDMPYLGICAGMQLMTYDINNICDKTPNVVVKNIDMHKSKQKYAHEVTIVNDSKLYHILGVNRIAVNSRHRYAISNPANYVVSAFADDNTIEAIENPNFTFQIGVQWHPESLDDVNSYNLFGSLVEEAKVYSLRRK